MDHATITAPPAALPDVTRRNSVSRPATPVERALGCCTAVCGAVSRARNAVFQLRFQTTAHRVLGIGFYSQPSSLLHDSFTIPVIGTRDSSPAYSTICMCMSQGRRSSRRILLGPRSCCWRHSLSRHSLGIRPRRCRTRGRHAHVRCRHWPPWTTTR